MNCGRRDIGRSLPSALYTDLLQSRRFGPGGRADGLHLLTLTSELRVKSPGKGIYMRVTRRSECVDLTVPVGSDAYKCSPRIAKMSSVQTKPTFGLWEN